ncbi:MAG: SpoIIIAH-like family protein [Butyricicoccus sp.]|nr:SpoIIIAH-like family protein [Butyricicoccus sp.]
MSKLKKRGAIYGIIAVMLGVAVYLNWSYVSTPDDLLVAGQVDTGDTSQAKQDEASSEETADAAETVSASDYFAQSRLSREQARDEAISILKETLQDETTDEKGKELATTQISQMADDSVTEARIESLIKAKGYQDAVVFLGSDSVNVIVAPPQAGFTETDASKIRDIVVAETSLRADQIKIVEAA